LRNFAASFEGGIFWIKILSNMETTITRTGTGIIATAGILAGVTAGVNNEQQGQQQITEQRNIEQEEQKDTVQEEQRNIAQDQKDTVQDATMIAGQQQITEQKDIAQDQKDTAQDEQKDTAQDATMIAGQQEQIITQQEQTTQQVPATAQQEQTTAQQYPVTAQQEQTTAQTLQVNVLQDFGHIFRAKEYHNEDMATAVLHEQLWQQKVSQIFGSALKDGKKLVISFKDFGRKDPDLFLNAIRNLYWYFPVQTVDDSITITDLPKVDRFAFERMRKSTVMEVYEPEKYAMRFKSWCILMNETDDMTDDEKIWLKYENSNNSKN
jgi:hypothetical protein